MLFWKTIESPKDGGARTFYEGAEGFKRMATENI